MTTSGKITAAAVAEFLKNNPDFTREWFRSNVTPDMIQDFGAVAQFTRAEKDVSPANGRLLLPTESATEMENGRNSITTAMFKDYVEGRRQRKVSHRKLDIDTLSQLNEQELFMELIRDIANELDVHVLCHKILLNVSMLTNSDRGSLFLTRGSGENKYLVSKLFDVTAVSTLEESTHTAENAIQVPFGKGIAGHVALSKETVNIKEAYQDPRFNKDVDLQTGYTTHSILCMPILNFDEEVIGVAQIINKQSGDHEFSRHDEYVFRKYLTFCGIGITNAQLFEMSVEEYKRNKLLLSLARGIFREQSSMDRLIRKIMLEAQDLLKCERCVVHLINTEVTSSSTDYEKKTSTCRQEITFSMIYDMLSKDGAVNTPNVNQAEKWKITDIARAVATSREVLNIPDFDADGRFSNDEDFKIKSLLGMPVFDGEERVIGVAQMINKNNDQMFTSSDINIFEAFAIFCGLGIHNTTMYENACKLMAKQSVALEVLSYHATAQKEEVDHLVDSDIPSAEHFQLHSFAFNDLVMSDFDTIKAVIRMFMEADIPNQFHVPYDVLCRWTLSVKKNYRPVTYHNWRHALNVTQTMFTMIFTGKMSTRLNELEIFGLLVACLCHDLDHRGTNNAFQSKTDSPLALLYSTSTMEHHHFDHSIMIINSKGNNIFQSLSPTDYRSVIKILENAILSTDLALYFKKRGDFQKLVDAGEKEWKEPRKRELLRGMLMTACDVAAICKPWEIQKEIAQLVAGEFFEQGDLERSKLNVTPIAMMDREKKDELPKMQVGFIDAICLPVYKILAENFAGLTPLYDGCVRNRKKWQECADQGNTSGNEVKAENSKGSNPPEKQQRTNDVQKSGPSQDQRNNQINKEMSNINNQNSSKSHPKIKGAKSKTCEVL